jgi:CheY-like chemotaxis protein
VLSKPIQTAEVLEDFLVGVRSFIDQPTRRIVVVDPKRRLADDLAELMDGADIDIQAALSADSALEAIHELPPAAIILTCDATDASIAELAERILAKANGQTRSIFLYVPTETPADASARWKQLAGECDVQLAESLPALVERLVQAIYVPVAKLPDPCQQLIHQAIETPSVLARKKVLIVDDDIRNIFALTSTLERYDIVTVSAETGRDAINLLQAAPDVDIVLMDIMMPEMDGIDTMRAIRRLSHFKKLPIIAVTAKAMKGDREKCIDAGAWDYLSKPVDPEQLLTVLRAWLTV